VEKRQQSAWADGRPEMGAVMRIKSQEIKTALTVMLLMLVFQAGTQVATLCSLLFFSGQRKVTKETRPAMRP